MGINKLVGVLASKVVENLKTVVIPMLAQEAITRIEEQLSGVDGEAKKQAAVDYVLNKIQLPLMLRPFRAIIASQLRNYVDTVIEKTVKELKRNI